jgi:site-specific DNA-methyltransferase (adenine-specific)
MSYELSNIINSIICADCYDVFKQLPDKSVDLVLTDPPYGIGESNGKNDSRSCLAKVTSFTYKTWDNNIPSPEFFLEIKRISKNQIVWGGNHFAAHLGNSPCWLVWHKDNGDNDFSDCELAWCSFSSTIRYFMWRWHGMLQGQMGWRKEIRIHPTQKPLPLFKWCLVNYSKPGDLVLDPMCGSGTTALACHALGRRFICIDKEAEYVTAARNRLLQFQAQGDLFSGENSVLVEENETNIQQTLYAAGGVPPLAGGTY